MIKSPFPKVNYATKNDLLELRGDMRRFQFEFGDFRKEMYVFKGDMQAFRTETKVRFDSIDARLVGADKRFDSIDARLVGADKRFDGIDKRLDSMTKNLSNLREEIPAHMGILRDGFRDDLRIVTDMVGAINEKVDRVEKNNEEILKSINELKNKSI